MQVKGMLEFEWKRSDVLAEFRSCKKSQTISVHAVVIHLLHERSLISPPSGPFLEYGRNPRWPHTYYYELTDTIQATAKETELTTLDSIDIERLERWTLKPQTNWCGSRRVNYTRR